MDYRRQPKKIAPKSKNNDNTKEYIYYTEETVQRFIRHLIRVLEGKSEGSGWTWNR